MKEIANNNMGYKDRRLILAMIGALALLVGMTSAFFGPLEIYCFYLFSEGGRFYFEGFGFGSLIFGNIASQIIGYYLIAALLIPLGYGHLKMRRWARTFALTLLWSWLVVGAPLTLVFMGTFAIYKDPSPITALIMLPSMALFYPIIPGLLIRFYRGENVRLTFEARDPRSYWTETLALPILVLCFLFSLYIIMLHIPFFFNGIFPFFGVLLFDMQGFLVLDVLIMCLACLIWGTLKRKIWAWWGACIYFGWLTFSSILAFSRSSYLDILSKMNFPPTEMEPMQNVPLQGFHIAAFVGLPLLSTLGAIIFSKRYFRRPHERSQLSL